MSSDSDQFIKVAVQEGIASLRLNRPPFNVLHIPMLQQLADALAQLSKDVSVRVLVLQAEGKLFSAGVDVADHTPEKVGEMIPLFDRVCQQLADFPVPTITAIHGHALGGGCELVICCDLAVMADSAKIGQPEIQLAAIAPIAALRLPMLVGYRAAADMLFNGRSLTAATAHQIGLVNQVISAAEVEVCVQEQAEKLAGLSRVALTRAKQALSIGYGSWSAMMPEMERLYLDDLMQTADAHEGLAAFMEKRQPVWKHS
jgi:cyclohexa-1,5-dienecarbonyl-CoA hydratase